MRKSPIHGKHCGALALALAAFACTDEPLEPTRLADERARSASSFSAGQVQPVTLDDHFAEIATQLPAFAGMFQRGDSLIVALTDVSASALAARSIIPSYTARHRIDGIMAPERLQMGFVQVPNNFLVLRHWYDQLNAQGLPPGVISVDVNEQTNRLTLGAATADAAANVLANLQARGFPAEVLGSEIVSMPVPAQTLDDYTRPLLGGIILSTWENRFGSSSVKQGTLGFTVYKTVSGVIDSSTKYLITVSHITTTQFGLDGLAFFQPTPAYSNYADTIAIEVKDPALFTGSPCPSGKMCRYSEAALAQVRPGVSWFHGAIAGSSATTPPTIPPFTTTYLHHTNNSGQTTGVTYKTGHVTGTTGGSVSASCIDIVWPTVPNSWLKCQWRINAPGKGGDSGSPVYAVDYWAGWYVLWPVGILHSLNPTETQFYYSPLSGAQQDFGITFEARTTCNFWNPPYCTW